MLAALSSLLIAWIAIPTRPAGINGDLHRLCDQIEQATAAGNWTDADRLVRQLPNLEVAYSWPGDRFHAPRDAAFQMWSARIPGLRFTAKEPARIAFSFADRLDEVGEDGVPKAIGVSSGEVMRVLLALRRGKEGQGTTDRELQNEVAYAVGRYLGLDDAPLFGSALSRTDLPTDYQTKVSRRELETARQVLAMADAYREAVASRQSLATERPKVEVLTKEIDLGRVVQGDQLSASIEVRNTGTGPLTYAMQPDCGCLRVSPSGTLGPGQSAKLRADYDSSQFVGPQSKRILIYTNDPANPLVTVPVRSQIQPAYRFIRPEGDTLVVSGRKGEASVFLYFPGDKEPTITGVRLDGLRATVRAAAWQGRLADPELGEGELPRRGYRYTIDVNDGIPAGRSAVTLTVQTAEPDFPVLRYNLYVQRGIIALPTSVFLGDLGKTPKTVPFALTRPRKPFKVLSVETGKPYLTAVATPTKGEEEYRITLSYSGDAPSGEVETVLRIRTNDAEQPVVEVPVRGTVG